jgi:hypothetical protein
VNVNDVTIKPCSQAHVSEVFSEFHLDDGSYPGQDSISALADKKCSAAVDVEVPRSTKLDGYALIYYYPTSASWRLKDDRTIQCILQHEKGPVTGSLRRAE